MNIFSRRHMFIRFVGISFCIAAMPFSQGIITGQVEVSSQLRKSKIRRLMNKLQETWALYQKKREQRASQKELDILERRIRTIKRTLIALGIAAATIAAILGYKTYKKRAMVKREQEQKERTEREKQELEKSNEIEELKQAFYIEKETAEQVLAYFKKTFGDRYGDELRKNKEGYQNFLRGKPLVPIDIWQALSPDVIVWCFGGYCFFSTQAAVERAGVKPVNTYKIHLMPKPEDVNRTLARLIKNRNINVPIKVKHTLKDIPPFPVIVLYVFDGQDAAQQLLNEVCREFAGWQGMDVTPRYNQRVTSFIYFAQGDGDYKARLDRDGRLETEFTKDGVYYSQKYNEEQGNPNYKLNVSAVCSVGEAF